jgi:GLPGLI family protein
MLPPDRQEEKAMIPEYRTSRFYLFFNEKESLFKPIPEDDDDDMDAGGGGNVRMHFRQPKMVVYTNSETGEVLSQRDFMGKDYLIQDSIPLAPWKFGTEKKTIQGYECQQAFYTDPKDEKTVTAWYTDKLRPELGPELYKSLPGAVLALDVDNGQRVTVASKIELRALKKNEIKKPTSGTAMSRHDFHNMVDEQVKKMGGHGGRIIIRN